MGAGARTATTVAVPATAKRGATKRGATKRGTTKRGTTKRGGYAVLFSRRRHADGNGRRRSKANDRRRAGDG